MAIPAPLTAIKSESASGRCKAWSSTLGRKYAASGNWVARANAQRSAAATATSARTSATERSLLARAIAPEDAGVESRSFAIEVRGKGSLVRARRGIICAMQRGPRRTSIERTSPPSPELFRERYLRRRTPLVLSGLASEWPACSSWTPDYLAERFDRTEVPVEIWSGPRFSDVRRRTMSLADYVTAMRERGASRGRVYLAGYRIFDQLPELAGHVAPFPYLDRHRTLPPYFFMGGPESTTPLHYDISHNFFAQIAGRKRVVLASPAHARSLYHPSLLDRHYWGSPVDVAAPDLRKYPRFADVELLEAVLAPGDVLFIPSRWRHALHSLDETISLGFFWQHGLEQRLATGFLRWIRRPSI